MPDKLLAFLNSLSKSEREQIWEWLDNNPHAIDEMIEIVGIDFFSIEI